MAIGEVSVRVVPDATDFNRKLQAKLGHLDSVDVPINLDTSRARAELAALQTTVQSSMRSSQNQTHALRDALTLLAPSILPLAGAAAAGGGALAAMGVAGVLAIKGVQAAMADGSKLGGEYAGQINIAKQAFAGLEQTAARDVFAGFRASVSKLNAEMPQFNQTIGQSAKTLGDIGAHVSGALVSGFNTFAPVISDVENEVDRLAATFEHWAGGTGGAKFAATLSADFKQAVPAVEALASAVVKLVGAFSDSSTIGLDAIQELSGVINDIPTPVLHAATDAFIAFKAATLASAGIKAASTALRDFAAAETVAGAASSRAALAATGLAGLATKLTPYAAGLAAAYVATDQLGNATAGWAQSSDRVKYAVGQLGSVLKDIGTFHWSSIFSDAKANEQASGTAAQLKALAGSAADFVASLQGQAGQARQVARQLSEPLLQLSQASDRMVLSQLTQSGKLSQATQAFGPYTAELQKQIDRQKTWTTVTGESTKAINGVAYSNTAWNRALEQSNFDSAKAEGILMGHTRALKELQTQLANAQTQQARLNLAYGDAETRLKLTSDQVDTYASVAGITAKQLANGALSAGEFVKAIRSVSAAVSNGSTSVQDWVAAVAQFNQGGDTAASRGQLIAAALKAANGDALDFAATLGNNAVAFKQFATDLNSAHDGLINFKTGAIDTSKAGAEPLLNDLQNMQTAAVNTAAAIYQHKKALGDAGAADKAFASYVANTQGVLISQHKQLGLTKDQAKALADQYFNIKHSGDLKKQIELIGDDKATQTLGKILRDLNILVKGKWTTTVDANTKPATDKLHSLIDFIGRQHPTINVGEKTIVNPNNPISGGTALGHIPASAAGGALPQGWSTVGEKGWEAAYSAAGKTQIFDHDTSKKLLGLPDKVPGFAGGTAGADKARQALANLISGIGQFNAGPSFAITTQGQLQKVLAQITKARAALGKDLAEGLISDKAAKADEQHLDHLTKYAENQFKKSQIKLGVTIEKQGFSAWKQALAGTVSDARKAFDTVAQESEKLGLSDAVINHLQQQDKRLDDIIGKRNALKNALGTPPAPPTEYDKLSNAIQRVRTAMQNLRQEAQTVANAVRGVFDITTSGTGPNGDKTPTGNAILAQQRQAAANARKFVRDIRELATRIPGQYLNQLAEQGPSALPQAEALLTLPQAKLRELAQTEQSINASAKGLGQFIGNRDYGAGVKAAEKQRDKIENRIKDMKDQIHHDQQRILAESALMRKELAKHIDRLERRPVQVVAPNGKVLWQYVEKGRKQLQGSRG